MIFGREIDKVRGGKLLLGGLERLFVAIPPFPLLLFPLLPESRLWKRNAYTIRAAIHGLTSHLLALEVSPFFPLPFRCKYKWRHGNSLRQLKKNYCGVYFGLFFPSSSQVTGLQDSGAAYRGRDSIVEESAGSPFPPPSRERI